jgi:ADP-heptose:LPS heptosyltransferase/GT2 family glycosyltransferase
MSVTAKQASSPPSAIVCIKVDTLGDLVLFTPTLQTIRRELPTTRLTVLIRRAYADLAPLLVDGVEWITTTLDPFAHGPAAGAHEVAKIRAQIDAIAPEVIIAATSRRNWLETLIAATTPAARRIAFGAATDDEYFATQLRIAYQVQANAAFTEYAPSAADEPDWQHNFRLADALLGVEVERTAPALKLSEQLVSEGASILSGLRLTPATYVVCAAAGFANVALKTWPADRFAGVLRHIRQQHGLRTLLVGHESERTHLESVVALAGDDVAVWLGKDGTLPQLAALLAGAALFVGNDTGAMHLAAALGIPTVGVFGGGTWPRFAPAGRCTVAVVQPLPCFGCGWDCAFGDAPCIRGIAIEDVASGVDFALSNRARRCNEIRTIEHLPATVREMMAKAATQYRTANAGHLARQHKLEELTALDHEKDAEIASLKAVCDEREKTIFILDGHVRNLQAHTGTLEADKSVLEKTLRDLPPDAAKAAKAIADQTVHIRNIEALLRHREQELKEARVSATNRAAGLHDLEQAKHYSRLLAERDTAILSLRRTREEQQETIKHLSAQATTATKKARHLWTGTKAIVREKISRPFDTWLFRKTVEEYWMKIGVLQHYAPRPLKWDDRLPGPRLADATLPQVGVITPSYGQEKFIERTLRSVIDQHYPKLRYVVQDGGSKDRSPEIIAQHADRLQHWESAKDGGQADAISRGFKHLEPSLADHDVMAWLNSDDLLGPGVLRYVAEYFADHPNVDVVYGHRIIIDDDDREIGRWIMPRHKAETLEWIDYVPQETMFWRKRAWDLVGGIDPSFQFALDWDLLARFHQARCRIVRLPYFLGAFRVHAEQKTSQAIHTTGAEEMRRIRTRFHGENQDDPHTIDRYARHTRFWGAITARLLEVGIRW